MTMGASFKIARAMEILCFSPPDNVDPLSPITVWYGVKIDFERGWVHLRKSNTEPIIRIYSEAKDETAANALAEEVIETAKSLY